MKSPTTDFERLDHHLLRWVIGGASRVTGRAGAATEEVKKMLTDVTSSIKDLAKSGSNDSNPMMMMMMMMMMGGGGGGGSAPPPAPPPPAPKPQISIVNNVGGR